MTIREVKMFSFRAHSPLFQGLLPLTSPAARNSGDWWQNADRHHHHHHHHHHVACPVLDVAIPTSVLQV